MNRKHELKMLRYLDMPMLLIVAALGVISYMAISSAKIHEPWFAERQLMFYGIGFAVIVFTLLIDYRRIGRWAYLFYGLGVVLLILVFQFEGAKGAQRWIPLGSDSDSFQLQPSEPMKIFIILTLAKILADAKEIKIKSWKTLALTAVLFAVPFGLIVKQPDLGSALVFVGIISAMLLVAGLDWRIIVVLVLIAALAVGGVFWLYFFNEPLLAMVLDDHQIERIATFVDPTADVGDDSWQVTQGMIAIGSGQLLGKGFHEGVQIHGNWIPEPHNDFVFAVIAEEFGFVGASVLLSLYIYLIYRMVNIALAAQDFYGSYIVAGVIGMLVFQVFQNIGMTVGLMPVTGLSLPFISYGGSSLLTTMLAVGIVLNIGMRRKKILFYNQ